MKETRYPECATIGFGKPFASFPLGVFVSDLSDYKPSAFPLTGEFWPHVISFFFSVWEHSWEWLAKLESSPNDALRLAGLSSYVWDDSERGDYWACAITKRAASMLDGGHRRFYSSISGDDDVNSCGLRRRRAASPLYIRPTCRVRCEGSSLPWMRHNRV